jgi:hypothetical protein
MTAALVSLLIGSCTASPSGDTPTSAMPPSAADLWAALHRPMDLPSMSAGGTCPRDRGHVISTGEMTANFLGDGPVFPFLAADGPAYDGLAPALFDPRERRHGWYSVRTVWVVEGSTSEAPILVRGGRLDTEGAIDFAIEGWGELGDTITLSDGTMIGTELRLRDGYPEESGWVRYPTTTLFRSAGCYAFQIDGADFTKVIVFEVAPSG